MTTILWPNGTTTPPNFSAEGHFGPRNSSAPNASKFHRGLDMWGIGSVRSISDGTVVAVGWGAGYGWGGGYQVWIQHDGFFSRYLHLVNGSSPLRVGQKIKAGDFVGTEGMTGAYQVHLHLEITMGQWHAGNYGQIDPRAWLEARVNGSASSLNDYDDLDNDMGAKEDIEFIKDQLGGSRSRKESLREQVDRLERQLGTIQKTTSDTRVVIGSTVTRGKNGDSLGVRIDKILKNQKEIVELLRKVAFSVVRPEGRTPMRISIDQIANHLSGKKALEPDAVK